MNHKRQPTSNLCFLCGKDNPHGLKIVWYNDYDKQEVYADIAFSEDYRSYPGVTHGGIVAAVLDETSGRATMLDNDFNNLMVTLKLEVVYKKVTPTNTPLRAVGKVIRGTKKRAQVTARLMLPDGSVTAECTALVYQMPGEYKDRWGEEAIEWQRTQAL
ncbi:MAG: PaaI family thioesterase [Elusimicrobiota bacterium]|nr:PaaI family thioesterase [Elusimicrobiota bacterium]